MSNISAPMGLPKSVSDKISGLRSRVIFWIILDGLARFCWLLIGLALSDFALDWLFQFDFSQRLILLAIIAGLLGWVLFRRLLSPLRKLPTDEALCHEVERSHPELGESLITSYQFAKMPADQRRNVSETLVNASVQQGLASAEPVAFGDAVNSRTLFRNGLLTVVAFLVMALGGVAVASTQYGSTWFYRNVMLGEQNYPQSTYFRLLPEGDEPIRIPRGENWTQIVEIDPASKLIPDEVFLDFRPSRGRASLKMQPAIAEGRFSAEFMNVIEAFEFRARAGSAVSPWRAVVLVEQPTVTEMQVRAAPPEYTSELPFDLPQGAGPFSLLRGTRIELSGKANKDLVSGKVEVTSAADEGKQAEYELAINNNREFTVGLNDDQWLLPDKEGAVPRQVRLRIILTDTDGLTSKRPTSFGVRVKTDRTPKVTVEKVGITGIATPQAVIPLFGKAEDDYAIKSLAIEYELESGDVDPTTTKKTLPVKGVNPDTPLPNGLVDYLEAVEVADLELKVGDRLKMIVVAGDNDNVAGPNIGRSVDLPIRIVSEDDLRADLLRREKEQRQELERLIKEQDDLRTDNLALAAEIANQNEITPTQKQQLMTLQRRQKLIANNLMIISGRIESFLLEIQNNRLEEDNGPLQKRLTRDVIEPMREIAEVDVTEAVRRIDEARRLESETGPRGEALQEAADKQEEILAKMNEVLKHLVKAEGYQEAINLLMEIVKGQQGVFDMTAKERQERIRRLLEGDSDPEPKPDGSPSPEEEPQPE